MLRSGTYWACACHISVTPSTGKIVVEKCTIAVDPGIVVNPAQLKRQVEGGAVIMVMQAGYELFGRVIRPAMVAVAAKTAAQAPQPAKNGYDASGEDAGDRIDTQA